MDYKTETKDGCVYLYLGDRSISWTEESKPSVDTIILGVETLVSLAVGVPMFKLIQAVMEEFSVSDKAQGDLFDREPEERESSSSGKQDQGGTA